MRVAYADPPYHGLAHKFYKDRTYDDLDAHRELIARLVREFDAWAYSLHTPSLARIAELCLLPDIKPTPRVAAWVKPLCSFKPGVNPAYSWEPVIFWRGRNARPYTGRTRIDWCSANMATERGLRGAKPEKFAMWLFDLLGATPDDEFVDVFPGTGGVGRTWDAYRRQLVMPGMG